MPDVTQAITLPGMDALLAYAAKSDASDSNLAIVVIALGIIGTVAVLALIPYGMARQRRHGQLEGIVAMLVVWTMLSAGSAIYTANSQLNWSKEYATRVESGYYDPRNEQADAPAKPWLAWGILGAAYVGAIVWAMNARGPVRRGGFDVVTERDRH